MDWNNVSLGELWDALQEVDWKAPRPVGEFLLQPKAFVLPKSGNKWNARVKNNLYYYRTNYAVILIGCFVACFLRNPVALLAIAMVTLGLLCLNDPFATSLNDQLLRLMKKVHTRTALRLRAMAGQHEGNLGVKRRGKRTLYILWLPRNAAVALVLLLGLFLMWRSRALLTLAWAILFGVGLPLLHASFRSPNLKARLASSREEFRAVWRGYQADVLHDYTM
mmetsp:Transcript_28479/g.62692  ORF Transcript_28479/g.62692 Transcript_28479/m.62692 type:complete len:222 (-) Transcript_28479:1791-2456(-)